MDEKTLAQYLADKPEAELDYPFGPEAQVYKVAGKMFALLYSHQGTVRVNLKCNPEQAQQLRDVFAGILPGYHMNKRHWNTILLGQDVPDGEVRRLVDHSYGLVLAGLPKAKRRHFETCYPADQLYCD
ncbi:hypothetical protein GCM10011297_21240 [Bacterioplanes sanyensis]|uniref:MmcQ/YjbR family DNA-binding protein n=1 Tax=Bacterioplanes sanyensis TaxID=1249553 RepID=UPI001672C0FE|nr:MmcQ/YjbR family DNA-binding protein [Bacterioplanes sanyensis]GGY48096.1 hypothetical protein GCM10011297_21240 [Bacterioplanes sanyensis]